MIAQGRFGLPYHYGAACYPGCPAGKQTFLLFCGKFLGQLEFA
jgi:hypothetical protein